MGAHPNREAVLQIIEGFLEKRIFRGWRVDGLQHDFQSGAYNLVCSNGDVTVRVQLLNEWIDEAMQPQGHFRMRHIKQALKRAFRIESDDQDDE